MRHLTIRGQSALLAVLVGLLGAAILAGPVSADQVPIGTTLSGGNEVPGPGDPNGSGTATLTIDTASGTVTPGGNATINVLDPLSRVRGNRCS